MSESLCRPIHKTKCIPNISAWDLSHVRAEQLSIKTLVFNTTRNKDASGKGSFIKRSFNSSTLYFSER